MRPRKYHFARYSQPFKEDGCPHCLTCRAPVMGTLSGWRCRPCGWRSYESKTTSYRRPAQLPDRSNVNGDALMGGIDAKLKACNYSPEMREELRSEIAMRILSQHRIKGHRVTLRSLTPAVVREIAKPLFKMQGNRFRDVSLNHQYGEDGQRLEDRLVG